MGLLRNLRLLFSCFIGSKKTKYEARYFVLASMARYCDLRLYNKYSPWFKENEFIEIWKEFPEYDGAVQERKFNLYYLAKGVSEIEGDTVECGVYRGASSYLIMRANKSKSKRHHIFDSFEGLSEPDQRDLVTDDRVFKWKKHDLSIPEKIVASNLQGSGEIELYKGWIPDRFGEVQDRTFSFVHIDVDLYQPTYDSIAFFYPRMNQGGIIVCDDYGSEGCPGAYKAFNDFIEDKAENIIFLTTGQGVIIKQ